MNISVESIRQHIIREGESTRRDRGYTREILSFSTTLYPDDFIKCNKIDLNLYWKMIQRQVPIFRKELENNKFSRRLFFQFNRFEKDPGFKDFFLCIESFGIFFVSSNQYDLIINFRSSDIDRLENDITIIKMIVKRLIKEFFVTSYKRNFNESLRQAEMRKIKIHCFSAHVYEERIQSSLI
jgi:hypothetical protein